MVTVALGVACSLDRAGEVDRGAPLPEVLDEEQPSPDEEVTPTSPEEEPDEPDDEPEVKFCDSGDANLVACYRFEEGSGTVLIDESRYGYNGTLKNVTYEEGVEGRAVRLSDQSEIRIPEPDGEHALDFTSSLTLELHMMAASLPDVGRYGLLDNNGQYGIFLQPGGEVVCGVGLGQRVSIDDAVHPDTWYHILCSYDGEELFLRVESASSKAEAIPQSGEVPTQGTNGVTLGSNNPDGDVFRGGLIDNVRLWRTVRK